MKVRVTAASGVSISIPGGGKRVVITEGELDAASWAEIQPTWPVVSLPHGAASAKKSIQKNMEWLQQWDEIVCSLTTMNLAGKRL